MHTLLRLIDLFAYTKHRHFTYVSKTKGQTKKKLKLGVLQKKESRIFAKHTTPLHLLSSVRAFTSNAL